MHHCNTDFNDINFLALYWKCVCVGATFSKFIHRTCTYKEVPGYIRSGAPLWTVGQFSLVCCTSMAHAGNTKIWAKIISTYAKNCSITGFSSLRVGGGRKTQGLYALSGHERIEKRSDQCS